MKTKRCTRRKCTSLKAVLSAEEIVRISEGILANTLINRYTYKSIVDYKKDGGMGTYVPKVTIGHEPLVETFDLTMDMTDLLKINRERTWALSQDELATIKSYFQREDVIRDRQDVGLTARATDVEMEALAQTWSEHCKHKIFNAMIDYREDGRSSSDRQPLQDLHRRFHECHPREQRGVRISVSPSLRTTRELSSSTTNSTSPTKWKPITRLQPSTRMAEPSPALSA